MTSGSEALTAEEELDEVVAQALEVSGAEREALIARFEERDPLAGARARVRLAALGELGFSLDDPRAEGWMPARFGRFTRLARVGRGGMSEVHLARDESSGELAAIKLVRADYARFDSARRRFGREAEALQRLEHPGIVRVLEVGDEGGAPWLALEWVGGASLEEVLDRLRERAPEALTAEEFEAAVRAVSSERPYPEAARTAAFGHGRHVELAARLVARVAAALACAHEAGVLHRDVKPANVLVTPAGRVLLVDFGLARPEGVDRLTRAGSWLGSLPYAAPEQLEGDAGALDQRADVYALGATLYELLTLRTPFLGGPEGAVRRRIATGDREPVRKLNPAASRELALVCESALDPDPRRRPPDARAFAQDLERALAGKRVQARGAPPWLRFERQVRRHPGRALVAALAVLVSLGAIAFGLRERARRARLTQLADAELVRGLIEEAREFWPPSPEELEPMANWLERTRAVRARTAVHEGVRASLEESALPYTDVDRASDQREVRAVLATLAHELVGLSAFIEHGDRLSPLAPPPPEGVHALEAETRALVDGPPERLFAELRARLAGAGELMDRAPARWGPDRSQLEDIRLVLEEAERGLATRSTWRFDSDVDTWRHAALVRLLSDLGELEKLEEGVRAQIAATHRLEAFADEEGARPWEEAWKAIAGSPLYGKLELEPVFGLVPLGPDERSGLWEFLLAASGDAPRGGRVGADTGVVLVLLPGGRFRMGLDGDVPRYLISAQPAHEVELAPYFIAKHELTFAQGERLGGLPHDRVRPRDGSLPLVLDWERSRKLLLPHGLELPTEAQWEYAARAGGGPMPPLEGHANVRDRSRVATLETQGIVEEDEFATFDDGQFETAPVGSFAPNGYGLHDTLGNVSEWCLDGFVMRGYATLVPRAGDGLRATVLLTPMRTVRGGSFRDAPARCLPELRGADATTKLVRSTGVRPVRNLGGE